MSSTKFPSVHYPVQGSNKFKTVSFPVTEAFRVDFGAQGSSGTATTLRLPAGTIVLGFVARVVETYVSSGAGTFQLGFTGEDLLTSALASAAAQEGAILTPTSGGGPLHLEASDTFDVIIGTSGGASAGKVDVFLTYIPVPAEDLSTSEFRQFVTSS